MSEDEFNEATSSQSLSELTRHRGSLKLRLTLFEKYMSKYQNVSLSEMQQAELLLRTESIAKILSSFNNIQYKIEEFIDDTDLLVHLEYREAFEDQYFKLMSVAKCLTGTGKVKDEKDNSQCPHAYQSKPIAIKLPEIKLPSFDGTFDHWLEYKNSYISMIHRRSDLDVIQKFHYLKSSLKGSALQVISSLEFTAANYTNAWELLENRYHNNRLLIHNHVKSLFNAQSVSKESPIQIRKLIDAVLRNLRALNSLDEPTDSWDTLLVYMVVSKLDSSTEREWENFLGTITSNSQRGKIKLDDLLTCLRNRADMLDMIPNNHSRSTQNPKPIYASENKKQTNIASYQVKQLQSFVSTRGSGKYDKSTRICVMCGDNHALYSCMTFLNSSVQDRSTFIDDKKLCRNCLRAGHPNSECTFGPCKQCHEKHNSLLHTDRHANTDHTLASPLTSAHNSQSAIKKSVSVVSYALNAIDHVNDNIANDNSTSLSSLSSPSQVLLSTALVEVMNNNNEFHTARALLDSGSQNCFITDKLR